MENRRQGSLPSQGNTRNPMASHGGSVNVRPTSSGGAPSSGLQRQQQLSTARSPLNRADTPTQNPLSTKQDKRILPVAGPTHISHRGSMDSTTPQQQKQPNSRSSQLKRQPEVEESEESSHDRHSQQHRHSGSDFGHTQPHRDEPHRHSKGSQHTHAPGHRGSGTQHDLLGARNSNESGSGHHHHSHLQSEHGDSIRSKPLADKYKERERQHMEDEMLKRAREQQIEKIKKEIQKEKRIMLIFSTISLFFGILWLIAVCISYWYFVYADENSVAIIMKGINDNNSTKIQPIINDVFISSHVGLWRICRTKRFIQSGNEIISCYWHNMFPTDAELRTVLYTDKYIVDYQRTEASFAIISLLVMAMCIPAALYTLKNTRYMFKRLAAGLYFLSSLAVLVIVEVTITKIEHESTKPYLQPPKSTVSYGFCFYIGWLIFAVNLVTACVYLVFSRKRKGENALDDDESEEEIIGR